MPEPHIIFNKYEFKQFLREHRNDAQQFLEEMRISVKEATNYRWDNQHFWISDIFGRPVLTFLIYKDEIALWQFHSTNELGTFKFDEFLDKFEDIMSHLEKNEMMCLECEKWFPKETLKHFGFTGVICQTCYDPKLHLPPDTRGD